ncbi:hypothetical protein BD324DRAFT_627825 [Kockovaella imperatae]|uniref:ER membrane protein complex subunit 10 n=1 Tax=Kockovaella imperatae TaxID=4999 RepID=A0A1Y1UHK2_9TREE|nr:hypothetical protein BD324DRAFT_627825 [Kockovaella imperatae]ORX36954.1 hypothetical protein BD324DRAFT_627825 [Kockovaella imperatae]
MRALLALHALTGVMLTTRASAASSSSYPLYHRFIPSSAASVPEFEPYGDITLDFDQQPVGRFEPFGSRAPLTDDGAGTYQLGLKVGEDMLMTSTKSCYTSAPQVYTFSLSLPDPESPPQSLNLKLANIPASGECPKGWYAAGDRLTLPGGIATGVEINLPTKVQGPSLSPPPSLDKATGKVKEPEPEKTFFQKYWLAIVGIGFFAFSLLGPAPPEGR